MAKYNLLMDKDNEYYKANKYYTLEDDIYKAYHNLSCDLYNLVYNNFYKKVMDYLEENVPSKIIMINHYYGMQNREDYNDFSKKYCPNVEQKEKLTYYWYDSFPNKNDFGDKYIYLKSLL